MNRIFTALLLVALSFTASADIYQAQYGVAKVFPFWLYNADGTLDVDEADGGTEVSLSCNQGAETTATNDFVDEGTHYSISLTAAELQCQTVAVIVNATVVGGFIIQTHGHASAFNVTSGWETGDSYARLGAPAGASVSADIAAIEAQTDDIGAAGAGLTAADDAVMTRLGAPVGASLSADLQVIDQNVDDVETDTADMQPKLGTFPDLSSGATLAGNLEDMRDDGTATYSRSTDSLQAIRDRGDAAWVTGGGGACAAGTGCIASGTAQAATSTTIQLASAETFADDEILCATVLITGGTGVGQSRSITDYVSSTDTATVSTWTTTPSGTITYEVYGTSCSSGDGSTFTAIPWNASWDAEVQSEAADALNADTGDSFTAIPWNASWDAEVQSEATDALNAYDPPTRAELTSDIGGLNDLSATDVRGIVVEDQGSVTLGCAMAVMQAMLAGDYTTSGDTVTVEDPSGTETRVSSTLTGGTRTVTITCPSY